MLSMIAIFTSSIRELGCALPLAGSNTIALHVAD